MSNRRERLAGLNPASPDGAVAVKSTLVRDIPTIEWLPLTDIRQRGAFR